MRTYHVSLSSCAIHYMPYHVISTDCKLVFYALLFHVNRSNLVNDKA